MEVGSAFVADSQAFELMKPGEGALDDPPGAAQAGAMRGATPGDDRLDTALPQQAAVLDVVVAAVGIRPLGPVPWSAAQPTQTRYRVEQGQQLGDVMAVAAGQGGSQRGATGIDDQVALGSGSAPVDRGGVNMGPPLTAQSSISSSPAVRSSAGRTSCRWGHTPASVPSRRRRRHLTPLQPIASAGTSALVTPVRRLRRCNSRTLDAESGQQLLIRRVQNVAGFQERLVGVRRRLVSGTDIVLA